MSEPLVMLSTGFARLVRRDAVALIDRMFDQGCMRNPMTRGILLQGLCRKRQVEGESFVTEVVWESSRG